MLTEAGPILVVDDDPDMREMVTMLLDAEGFRVACAANGAQALRMVADEMPALILLDMRMPVMDGWDFARAFRALHGRRAPLVVLTAAEDACQRSKDVDAEDFLGKPFHLEELLALVRKWLRQTGEPARPQGA